MNPMEGTMFRQILVPLDGSEFAERALPYAQRLAALMDGTLHLVCVVSLPSPVRAQGVGAPVNVYADVIASERQNAATYLESVKWRLQRTTKSVQMQVLDGNEAAALLDYLPQAGIDLVVMTTHGREGLVTRWTLGSVADRVAHGSTVPVLLVPTEESGRGVRFS